jgi:nitrogen fixation NifU-like protein
MVLNLDEARRVLTEHSRSKRNGVFPQLPTHQHQLTNPICGDHVQLQLEIKSGHIEVAGFRAKGCAICTASSSMLCDEVKGKSASVAVDLSNLFEKAVTSSVDEAWPSSLQSLSSFMHLRVNPSRRTCALLPWIALRSALKEEVL